MFSSVRSFLCLSSATNDKQSSNNTGSSGHNNNFRNTICVSVLTRHADAGELALAVEAGAEVEAGVGVALVHIHLAPRPGVALQDKDDY